jgi:7-alpha-hydroxysteroid dehydrogenase
MTAKVMVVTGAGRGIGAAIARAYAEAGADVVVAARTVEQIERTAREVAGFGRRSLAVPCDVMREEQLATLVERTLAEFGRIDVLVNNAGGSPPNAALNTSVKELEAAFRFNVSSAFAATRLAVPHIVATAGGGSILNISSVAGRYTSPFFAAYGTAKAALSFLTQELAQEFAPKVRVNAIAVGATKTDALNTVLTPEIEKTMVDLTPMARLGEVEDIAACALYLASPAASYVTGEVLGVSGGLNGISMKMPRAFD